MLSDRGEKGRGRIVEKKESVLNSVAASVANQKSVSRWIDEQNEQNGVYACVHHVGPCEQTGVGVLSARNISSRVSKGGDAHGGSELAGVV